MSLNYTYVSSALMLFVAQCSLTPLDSSMSANAAETKTLKAPTAISTPKATKIASLQPLGALPKPNIPINVKHKLHSHVVPDKPFLSGLFVGDETTPDSKGFAAYNSDYYFFRDGRVYEGTPPEGPSRLDWDRVFKLTPEKCGHYGINGNTITFQWGDKDPEVWKYIHDGHHLELDGVKTRRVESFALNGKLSGTFSRVCSAATSSAGVKTISRTTFSTANRYVFYSDGTFTKDDGQATKASPKHTGIWGASGNRERGAYRVSGNDMELREYRDIRYCTGYPQNLRGTGTAEFPEAISIEGELFERTR